MLTLVCGGLQIRRDGDISHAVDMNRMMVISNPLGCHSDIRADSVMESTCLLYKYFLYCHYAVGVYCLDDVETLYRLL